jgi:phytoene/squalene synthetase
MAVVSPVEFKFCNELAMPPGSLFEFTSRFLPADRLESLLALYALIQTIGKIPDSPVDEAVKWAKLKWWSEELVADPDAPSRHPVLRALWLSGARMQLKNDLLLRLLTDAVAQIDVAPDCDENAMFERFAGLGSTEIQLELALDKAAIDTENLSFLAAASRLSRVISSFSAQHQAETGQLPMNVLAKYNVSAAQLEQNMYSDKLAQILTQLADCGLDWFSKGMSGLKIYQNTGGQTGLATHLQLRWTMERRRLSFVRKDASRFLGEGKRYGPADAWFSWRFLRRLK